MMPRGVSKYELADPRQRQVIDQFIDSLGGLSPRRIKKYRFYLGKIGSELGKQFESVTQKDLLEYIKSVNASDRYTDSTKRDIRLITKKFFRWLRNDEFVKWIKIGEVKETVKPEDVLTDAELQSLRGACKNVRDKALIETIYETAFRPEEFLSLKIGEVVFDDYGAVIHLRRGKTGGRGVRVINAAPLLANWIENHPHTSRTADTPLWVDLSHGRNGGALKWMGLKKVLSRLKETSGLTKNLHPYIFRHTRLTNLASTLTESQLCAVAGWTQGSEMPRMYVHFSQRDTDDAILKVYGLKKADVKEVPTPKRCVRCGTTNPPTGVICSKCGMALTLKAAMRKDDELDEIKRNQAEILRLLKAGAKVDPALVQLPNGDLAK